MESQGCAQNFHLKLIIYALALPLLTIQPHCVFPGGGMEKAVTRSTLIIRSISGGQFGVELKTEERLPNEMNVNYSQLWAILT